jgi:serine/threonine protein kinase
MNGQMIEGQVLGEYEILHVAGAGGMGIVYRAVQRSLGRAVALKVIREEISQAPEYRERFLREARLAASVDHPHVVSVYDVGESDHRLFLAMQWIDGEDLRHLLERSGRLESHRAVAIAIQVAEALDAVHGVGDLIHRDVKPANVLLRTLSGKDHAYLTDFGVARPAESVESLIRTGWTVGTAGYLAPEQIMGREPDRQSDLYALGCVFFEMLTGQPPFQGPNEMALRWAHAHDPRPLASVVAAGVDPRYDDFLLSALAVDPQMRFSSGAAFALALSAAEAGQAAPNATAPPQRPHVPTAVGPPTPIPGPPTPPGGAAMYPGYGYPTPVPPHTPPQRSGNPLALVILGLVALAGIAVGALAAAGVFSTHTTTLTNTRAAAVSPRDRRPHKGSQHPTSPPTSTTQSSPTATTPSTPSSSQAPSTPLGPTTTYAGRAFSISYPAQWITQDAEAQKSYGTDTTFVSPSDSNTLMRVDVTANPSSSDPMVAAQPVVSSLEQQPGYSQIDLSRGTFEGFPAVHWEFTVDESGVQLHKEDEFFTDTNNGDSVAVLTQAPESEYASLSSGFSDLRQSLSMN